MNNSTGRSSGQVGLALSSQDNATILIVKGLLIALLLSFIFLALNTLLLYFSPLSEAYVPYLIFGGTLLSIFWGSVYVGKRTEEKGWLRGGLTGLFYVLTLMLFCFLFNVSFEPGINILTKLFLGFVFGSLGGILGINS
ncbi:MAG TPA: TIGR04086 family membrane protein [Firmicutes bacterium]|jgi:putative membrane protein (TIGR04086 family)|nr:TIGR04086 family membrane protein [Bacillota bacterium]